MLKKVVLPAPLGPIRLTIAPRGIVKSTSLTATSPPNRLVQPVATSRSSTAAAVIAAPPATRDRLSAALRSAVGSRLSSAISSSTMISSLTARLSAVVPGLFGGHADPVHLCLRALDREQALGSLDHHDREHDPEDQVVVGRQAEVGQQLDPGRIAEGVERVVDDVLAQEPQQRLIDVLDDEGADDDAPERADPAEDDDHDHEDRHVEVEALREDRRLIGAGERPREAREARAQRERQQLAGDGVDAHRRGRRLVLADGHPGATELGVAEPRADDEGQRQQGRHAGRTTRSRSGSRR